MVDSGKIVVTDKRLLDAFSKVNNIATGTSSVIEEKSEQLRLQLGLIKRFYPGTDKALVKLNSGDTVRCVLSHLVVSDEMNVFFMPTGTVKEDKEYHETAIFPDSDYWCVVLDIRNSDNQSEYCILGCISRDTQKIKPNPFAGEFEIHIKDTVFKIDTDGVNITGKSIKLNNQELSTTEAYNKTEIDKLISTLETRIQTLETEIEKLKTNTTTNGSGT